MSNHSIVSMESKEFNTRLVEMFRKLRTEPDFCDLTLDCEDSNGKTLKAHKVILAASSSVFRSILSKGGLKPPLYLKGISFYDLQTMLDFIYLGKVEIPRERLQSFLSVARAFQIYGLSEEKNITCNEARSSYVSNGQFDEAGSENGADSQEEECSAISEELIEDKSIRCDDADPLYEPNKYFDLHPLEYGIEDKEEECPVISDVRSLSPHLNDILCQTNGLSDKNKGVEDHDTVHSTPKKFSCDICGSSFSRRFRLKSHVLVVHHKIKTFNCETCGNGPEKSMA